MYMKNTLEQFKEKTYFADETVIINLFGDSRLVEDFPLLHLLQPEHYLLITEADFKNSDKLKQILNQFSEQVNKNWPQYIEQIWTYFIDTVDLNIKNQSESKAKILNFYLAHLLGKDPATIKKMVQLFDSNKQQFKKELINKINNKYIDKLNIAINNPDLVADLKKILPATKKTAFIERKSFVNNQMERLISNANTHDIVTDTLSLPKLRIIIGTDLKKFGDIIGRTPLNSMRVGQASTDNHLIFVYWGSFGNDFPSLSLLGGMQMSDYRDCVAQDGAENGRGYEFAKPLLRLLAEEFFDYWLKYHQLQEKKRLSHGIDQFKDLNLNSLEDLTKSLTGLTEHAKMTTLLRKHDTIIQNASKLIQEQEEIVNAVLADKSLSTKQKKLWQKMLAKGQASYEAANPKPGRLISAVTTDYKVGTATTVTMPTIPVPVRVTLKRFVEITELNCQLPPDKKLAMWETAVVKGKLNEKQVATIYRWFIAECKIHIEEIKGIYRPEKFVSEFLGKMFGYHVFLPGYLEAFFTELSDLYIQLYKEKPLAKQDTFTCDGDDCVVACEVDPDTISNDFAGMELSRPVQSLSVDDESKNNTKANPRLPKTALNTGESSESYAYSVMQWGFTLFDHIYNAWQSAWSKPSENQQAKQQAQNNKSTNLYGQVTEQEGVPALKFADSRYTTYVFAKAIDGLLPVENIADPIPVHADNFTASSCRPVEFNGEPSIYCEGEATTMIYTPKLPEQPLQNLDGNIMLAAVAAHSISKLFKSSKANHSVKQVSLEPAEYQQQILKCEKKLQKLENIFKSGSAALPLAIQELQDDLADLKAKGSATAKEVKSFIKQIDEVFVHLQHDSKWHEDAMPVSARQKQSFPQSQQFGKANNFFVLPSPSSSALLLRTIESNNHSSLVPRKLPL